MKTILYQRDDDKILVSELETNEEQFINYNKKTMEELFESDYENTTSDLAYNIDKEYFSEKNKYNLKKYHKIYSNATSYNEGCRTYLIPKINRESSSIYNKFLTMFPYYSGFCASPDSILPQLNLGKLPKYEDIKVDYKNYTLKDELFYFPMTDLAIRLNSELRLLYKLLYIKHFELTKNDIISKSEFKKIFTLNFKEVLSYSTYMDILSSCYPVINDSVEQTINSKIDIDAEKIKKIKLILK